MYKLLSITFFVSVLTMCSIDYDSAFVLESLNEEIPDYVIYDLKQTDIDNKGGRTVMTADKAEAFNLQNETKFYNIDFQQKNNKGDVTKYGHSDYGVLMENNDALLEGSVYVYSNDNQASIEADELSWTNEEKILTSHSDKTVKLTDEDGSVIQGKGFYADFRKNEISFNDSVTGKLVYEEKKEEAVQDEDENKP